jgi:hypothetical protein
LPCPLPGYVGQTLSQCCQRQFQERQQQGRGCSGNTQEQQQQGGGDANNQVCGNNPHYNLCINTPPQSNNSTEEANVAEDNSAGTAASALHLQCTEWSISFQPDQDGHSFDLHLSLTHHDIDSFLPQDPNFYFLSCDKGMEPESSETLDAFFMPNVPVTQPNTSTATTATDITASTHSAINIQLLAAQQIIPLIFNNKKISIKF